MIWPIPVVEPLVTITPTHPESGVANTMFNGGNLSLNTYASTAWPTASKAFYIPFFVSKQITFTTLFTVNGATTSGNIDLGVYDANGTKIVSSGSTAQSGASALQKVTVASTSIGPGIFYLAMSVDNVTATVYRTIGGQVLRTKMTGMAEQASAFVLPATATFATLTPDFIPMVGLSVRSSI